MNFLFNFLISAFCAAISAMGMGGGGILLIYLTAYAGFEQRSAQGINLVFFVPVAIIAILMHSGSKFIKWKYTLIFSALGFIGVYFGFKTAMLFKPEHLSKLFGIFLLIIGFREFMVKDNKPIATGIKKGK